MKRREFVKGNVVEKLDDEKFRNLEIENTNDDIAPMMNKNEDRYGLCFLWYGDDGRHRQRRG